MGCYRLIGDALRLKSIQVTVFISFLSILALPLFLFSELSKEKIQTFRQELQDRFNQANKTILVQVRQPRECYELYDYISKVGTIEIMYHYENKERLHFALIQMDDVTSVYKIFENATMKKKISGMSGMPSSNFFSYEPTNNNKVKLTFNKNSYKNLFLDASINLKSDSPSFNYFDDIKLFSERLLLYYEQSKIDDLNLRLRFLTAKQVESSVKILNPTINVVPIGSSITGFGNKKSDLDLVAIPKMENNTESRLLFHMKTVNNVHAVHLNIVEKFIQNILPGCYLDSKQKVSAETMYINFSNQFTSQECSLALYNYEALMLTEMLHLVSNVDVRIKSLAFLIQRWGNVMSLTKKLIYEKCISNHALLCLIIFFLQQKHLGNPSLLLPLEKAPRTKSQLVLTNDKYLNQLAVFQRQAKKNKQSVEELAFLFFQFYSNFDFERFGISIKTGQVVTKLNSFSNGLFLEDPFYSDKNLCSNVTSREIKRFQEAVKDMHQKLDASFKSELFKESVKENLRSV